MKYKSIILGLLLPFLAASVARAGDREAWVELANKIAGPVLRGMADEKLVRNMPLEFSPSRREGRDSRVAYMEAFGRLMMGIAPWLALPDDDTPEGIQRKQLRQWALKAYANAVNPDSPDYLLWRSDRQTLVDAAFLASSFLRAPDALWQPLDAVTKQRYIEEFTRLRRVTPGYSNWLLFASTIETFLLSVDEPHDFYRIRMGLAKTEEWYVGDGWYSDGPGFAFDYYNSFVIQPMYLEILEVLAARKIRLSNGAFASAAANLDAVQSRIRRYSVILERLISPEGAFPAFGRSIAYRLAVFQPLSLVAWKQELPASLPEGQVRAALTATMRRIFESPDNFTSDGFLRLGFSGYQPDMTDSYINTGSLYLTAAVFLPLGLPPSHSFWTSPAQPWTAQKAWSGQPFPKDMKLSKDKLPSAKSAQ